ncbi:hypothetical protein [Bacillus kexueae]|uniref:DUF7878 domain-containing protein n=1 Tax=Aeribacillus kexueae TaxID=2078952 RepID=UPI001FAF7D3D|nr:hypothetical protein [Bacillus kexueae]
MSIEFIFQLLKNCDVRRSWLNRFDGSMFVRIQGELEIRVNGDCYFYEPSIALVELAYQLKRWNKEDGFQYDSIELHDGPIMSFTKIGDNRWEISSIWSEGTVLVDSNELFHAVDVFLSALDRELYHKYCFRINFVR